MYRGICLISSMLDHMFLYANQISNKNDKGLKYAECGSL